MENDFFLHVSAKKKRPQSISRSCKKTRFFAFFAVSKRGECATNSLMDFFFSPCSRVPFLYRLIGEEKKVKIDLLYRENLMFF